ncbi:MAG: hypothetical protein COW19_07545 [Zetaproteobacteria bacterium CG12_big_fil_rev_8_21_14_0_65_55_1124]|nr:MAG: hypothetical protein COT53_03260 [Zetaproteobacteria bacterium CG08_land_8_20_14_0_20_55_17]PIW42523.1 MAG: hypothetical protein COW19_07545 [Zetaproteobacteria bacterium CG12_big_fil_rev_8_21_14_0_65_55_1124]
MLDALKAQAGRPAAKAAQCPLPGFVRRHGLGFNCRGVQRHPPCLIEHTPFTFNHSLVARLPVFGAVTSKVGDKFQGIAGAPTQTMQYRRWLNE